MISVRLLIPLLLLAFSSASFALTDSSNSELLKQAQAFSELEPEREQREASIHIARSLLLSHYRKQDIDKSLSEKVFDNYIDSLDPQKLYFLKDDIDYFSAYRERLHGALKTGQLEPGFNIYNLFQSRYIDRLTKKIALIENDLPNFDFTKDEEPELIKSYIKFCFRFLPTNPPILKIKYLLLDLLIISSAINLLNP